jgi:DNA-binding CsgD family transcriptional regulator
MVNVANQQVSSVRRVLTRYTRRNRTTGPDALTASELRVARLAADDATNREIAQALFVSKRTVETHLTSAYRKLGITSRQALKATLVRLDAP